MNLNGRGQAALGVGAGPGSVDGRVVATPGGGICFVDDDRVILQTEIDIRQGDGTVKPTWVVIIVRLSDGEVETPAPAIGANALAAGGGRWMAWLAGTGLYGTLPPDGKWARAGLVAAGPDGTLGYCPDYASGVGVVLNAPDGTETVIPDAMVVDRNLQVLGPTSAVWQDFHGGLRVFGRAPLRPTLTPGRTRLVTLDGEDWLVYQSDRGLVAQLDGAAAGYVLETRPITFNHDARAVDGQLVVAWSITQGEGPSDLRKVTVDRSQPRVPLALAAAAPAFSLTHPVLVCVFKDPEGTSGAPAEIVVNQNAPGKAGRPFFAAEDSIPSSGLEELLGIYSESSADPHAALSLARSLNTRLMLVRDMPGPWSPPGGLPPETILGRELYWYKAPGVRASDPTHPGETLAAAVARWRVEVPDLLDAWPGDCAVVAQFYCMGGAPPDEVLTEEEVLEVLTHLSEIVNLSPRIKVIDVFAFLRANGITAHPKLRAALEALLTAAKAAGTATLMPIGIAPAPKPSPTPPAPPPPKPVPAPSPAPVQTPVTQGDFMLIDPTKEILYYTKLLPSTTGTGLNTLQKANGNVYSIRSGGVVSEQPSNFDGHAESFRVSGSLATTNSEDGVQRTFGIAPVDGL